MIYPMVLALRDSLYKINTITRVESFVGLDNYLNLRTDSEFWDALWKTVIWVVGAIGSQAIVGILVALALNKRVRGRNFIRGVVLFPYLVPAIVAVLTWRWILSGTVGLANYLLVDASHLLDSPVTWFHTAEPIPFVSWAMISVILMSLWKYLPYWALFVLARLQSVPEELNEAALIDGASAWQRFRYVTWPWIAPVVMVLVILRSIWAFREFDMVYLPAYGGPLERTTTIPVYIRRVAWDYIDIGRAAAVAIALLFVVILMNQVYLRIYERSEARLD
jgi:multiple sugar transport system permease protein